MLFLNLMHAEHHYLFGRTDFQERSDWKLPQGPPRDGELLMSTGIYHSPLNLVVSDFGIIFTNINGQKDKKFVGEPWKLDFFPVYLCRKAFDVSARKCIPLNKAIVGSDINFSS